MYKIVQKFGDTSHTLFKIHYFIPHIYNLYKLDLNNISQKIRWFVSFLKYFGKNTLLNDN